MYWDINKILPYQRNFNLINGERSIGKTYTTQKWVVNRCIKNHQQFIYIVRTQEEKKNGVFALGFEKVLLNEFPDYSFKFSTETCSCKGETIGHCIALSESHKIKKRSFPLVYYIIFDEYMLESGSRSQYVSGWDEPDLFLSIYHTVDREEDRVKCFLLGNNTSFYNPYHMHPAFNVQPVHKGEIWTSENVLYQWAVSDNELKKKKQGSKFLNMIEGTKYGKFAKEGDYIEDNTAFLGKHSGNSIYIMTLETNGMSFGVYNDVKQGVVVISDHVDPSCPFRYAITLDDHTENTMLTKMKDSHILWLSKAFKIGCVRFESMAIKKLTEEAIQKIL